MQVVKSLDHKPDKTTYTSNPRKSNKILLKPNDGPRRKPEYKQTFLNPR